MYGLTGSNKCREYCAIFSKERVLFPANDNDFIREVPVHKGDFFFIEPGTVHAIKGGTVILETQQSSDITYRVYDYIEETSISGTNFMTYIPLFFGVEKIYEHDAYTTFIMVRNIFI